MTIAMTTTTMPTFCNKRLQYKAQQYNKNLNNKKRKK